jgi:hypothetical protein
MPDCILKSSTNTVSLQMLNRLSCRLDAAGIRPLHMVSTKPVVRLYPKSNTLTLVMEEVLSETLIDAIFASDKLSKDLKTKIYKELNLTKSQQERHLISLSMTDSEGQAYYLVNDKVAGYCGSWIDAETHEHLISSVETNKLSYAQLLRSKI